jgi:nicotinate-nucleotide adenylyltransferase
MDLDKRENKKKIGILGGTFDPAHKGHLSISKETKKRFGIDKIIWAVTKKNPFKDQSSLSLSKRINFAKKFTQVYPFIKVKYFEDKIKSNRTVDLIKYIKKNNKNTDIYFIMGADSLINFHKWKNSDLISSICNILVFDRDRYKAKSLSSRSFKKYSKKSLKFIKFNKVNISSSKLRKI